MANTIPPCVLTPDDLTRMGLLEDDIENIRHMVGMGHYIPRGRWGFRNYFAAGGSQIAEMARLENNGLVERGGTRDSSTYFRATSEGCRVIGMCGASIRRALGGDA